MALHIFCALKCEAEPIIDNFKLIRLNDFKLFKIYQSIDQETSLVITNVGKNNAKNAVAYHHDCIKTTKSDIWFNIGIAGHENIAIGEIRLINKIVDSKNKSCWYPQIIFDPPCDSIDLISLERPSNEYQTCLYDMEASGFYSAASQYGISELIHSVKVISDNTNSSISKINKDQVKQIVRTKMSVIQIILDKLRLLSVEMQTINKQPKDYEYFLEKWHFTQTEKHQLHNLILKLNIRYPNKDFLKITENLDNGKLVLKKLEERLSKTEFSIY